MKKNGPPERVADILSRLLCEQQGETVLPVTRSPAPDEPPTPDVAAGGHYDFDLAEFPLFRLNKLASAKSGRDPIRYADTITGRDGRPVQRQWTVHPGAFGFGGQSTQVLLFDLLQLYAEQGARGTQIQFGTLRSLFLRRGERNPSGRDYDRLRRDFDILRGYDIHCVNAFWDSRRQAYVDMNWRLFESVFYFRPTAGPDADGQPFGFVEVSSVLRTVARTRGFFHLGFDRRRFYALKPLEQRLAVYLAKQFTSQKLHRRFVGDLARVLPIEAGRERDVNKLLSAAANGLLAKSLPTLAAFRLTRANSGGWLAEFNRGVKPAATYTRPRHAVRAFTPAVADLVARIGEAVGSADDDLWWARCAERLGPGAVDRGLGLLKEARRSGRVSNPGGLLTKFFKDIADEGGIALS
jgi:hypothetical protein